MEESLKKFDPSLVHSFSVLQPITFAAVALNKLGIVFFVFPKYAIYLQRDYATE